MEYRIWNIEYRRRETEYRGKEEHKSIEALERRSIRADIGDQAIRRRQSGYRGVRAQNEGRLMIDGG